MASLSRISTSLAEVRRQGRYILRLWLTDLARFLPSKWLARLEGLQPSAILDIDPEGVMWVRAPVLKPEQRVPLVSLQPEILRALDRRSVVLQIPATLTMRHVLEVPKAATIDLSETLRHSLSVWTPFSHEEAYATASVVGNAHASTRCVELRCSSRVLLQSWLDRATAGGVEIDTIEFGDSRFRLSLCNAKALRLRRSDRLTTLGFAVAAIQIMILIGVAHYRQVAQLEGLESALRDMAGSAREQATLRKNIEDNERALATVSTRQREGGRMVRTFAALADLLPQDTYLRELDLSDGRGRVVIVGSKELDPVSILGRGHLFKPIDVSNTASPVATESIYTVTFSIAGDGGRE